ncbi:hypothetical protein HK44_023600 [Pseudomonas fluorescens HK44]|uniref:Uncharacterized protein n=2 Tax=Pseudomonas fluorescens TaxID=294 RepID=A0A010SXV2_PSEFL|nr:hypothetical protein HK44_023600 [Pseudomonas fluorescens HK44]
MPPTIAGAGKPTMANRTTDRPRLVLTERIERPAQHQTSTYTNAATSEWRQARDQYLNHIMVCRSCYAPTGRHCTAGALLRANYDNTPMEAHP